MSLVATERLLLAGEKPSLGKAVSAGNKMLDYLGKDWLKENLWRNWSDAGAEDARRAIGVDRLPAKGVVTTGNHLESFNSKLKNRYIKPRKHGGRGMRLDVFVYLSITDFLPSIFKLDAFRRQTDANMTSLLLTLQGGHAFVATRARQAQQDISNPSRAYRSHDPQRDQGAQEIFSANRVVHFAFRFGAPFADSPPSPSPPSYQTHTIIGVDATIAPTTPPGPHHQVSVFAEGTGSCSCPDWTKRGGACKHMRAVLDAVARLRMDPRHHYLPPILLPRSRVEAGRLLARLTDPLRASDLVASVPTEELSVAVLETFREFDGEEGEIAFGGETDAELDTGSSSASSDDSEGSSNESTLSGPQVSHLYPFTSSVCSLTRHLMPFSELSLLSTASNRRSPFPLYLNKA